MPVNPYRLKKGKEYIIINYDNGKRYKGTLVKITSMIITMKVGGLDTQFMHYDEFHDLDEIKTLATIAKRAMEQRALDTVLKKLFNENFEW